MSVVDHRLARRRLRRREQGARRVLGRVLVLLGLIALLTGAAWVAKSPYLRVSHIEVSGAAHSRPGMAFREAGLRLGIPLVSVRGSRVEAALRSDPWVARAHVTLAFPDTVQVTVEERSPLIRLRSGRSWLLVARDGTVLGPWKGDEDIPVVAVDVGPLHPGDRIESPVGRGALQLLAALPPALHAGAQVKAEGGELWAKVDGRRVRLGRPVEMKAKAAALAALLAEGIPKGAEVNVVAPSRPAVRF